MDMNHCMIHTIIIPCGDWSFRFPCFDLSSLQYDNDQRYLCVSQFQPRASSPSPGQTPGHLKKLFKCPALRAIFVGKCPAPLSFCGGQMPDPPVHPINIQSYWLPYFNKHNCFSSIELHKTGHEMSHFD